MAALGSSADSRPFTLCLLGVIGGLWQEHDNARHLLWNQHDGGGGECAYRGKPGAGQLLRGHQKEPDLKEGELDPPRGRGTGTMELGESGGLISFGQNEGGVGQALGSLTAWLQGTWGHSTEDGEGRSWVLVLCPLRSPKSLLTWMEALSLNPRRLASRLLPVGRQNKWHPGSQRM